MPNTSPYLENSDPALVQLSNAPFSVTFWLNQTSTSGTVATTIILAPAFQVVLNADGTLTFTIRDSVSTVQTSVSTVLPIVLGWNFVEIGYDLAGLKLNIFLNGIKATASFIHAADFSFSNFTTVFQLGTSNRFSTTTVDASFGLDEVGVWSRLLTDAEVNYIYNSGTGRAFPYFDSPFNLVFQANLINTPAKPLVLGSTNNLWVVNESFSSSPRQFIAQIVPLYTGVPTSLGFSWTADNFDDKVLFAQHDNLSQYWTPPLPRLCQDLPGLPSNDSNWDGVSVVANHAMLWKEDRIKWSDINDFTNWIPVATTAVSSALSVATDFVQPSPGGNVSVTVVNPAAAVVSISVSGSLSFPNTNVGSSSTLLLSTINSGTTVLDVTGISLPPGFSGNFAGSIPVGGSQPVIITFTPTAAISYDGAVTVSSNATTGTYTLPLSGTGIGTTKIISLSGILTFGECQTSKTIQSALVITNSGNTTLNVSSISLPAGFSHGTLPATVAAGASAPVTINFNPTAAISYAGSVSIISDATAGTAIAGISGVGVSTFGSSAGIFLTDLGTCQFGNVATGSTPTGTIKVVNPSSNTLTIVGATFPAGFTGTFPSTVAPNSTATVTATFSPIADVNYGGIISVAVSGVFTGSTTIPVSGTGIAAGKVIQLSGSLDFGSVQVGNSIQSLLKIKNIGTITITVSSITYPSGFSGAYSGTILPGVTKDIIVTFSPTSAVLFSGTVTVNSDASSGTNTISASGTGTAIPSPIILIPGQTVTLADPRGSLTYYNYYTVISQNNLALVLMLQDLTGVTPAGLVMPADGRQFFTLDANEAGELRVVGANMNGPIFKIIQQGDYAYSFKERSIQSIQYTGFGNGIFFIHNEVSTEGLIAREAVVDRDGTFVFLGHKELYTYQGGPNPTPVCQQATPQLYKELDRSRLEAIRVFHNENRKEIWVKYPVIGGFRVLIWNYVEDSASIDDYDPRVEFTAIGRVDWSSDVTWGLLPPTETWESLALNVTWQSLVSGGVDHVPLLACADGNIRIHGLVYSRDGAAYKSLSETMDFDFRNPDIWKYVDVVVIGLDVKVKDNQARTMYVQTGGQASLSGADIVWSDPQPVLVNGSAPIPVKVNPGGAGRFLRLRFSSQDADVQWRVSSFEIHCRPGGKY